MAMDCGAPMLIANGTVSLFEVGVHKFGDTTSIDAMVPLFEAMADIKFANA